MWRSIRIAPDNAWLFEGTWPRAEQVYTGISGPQSFGSGDVVVFAPSYTGDPLGLDGFEAKIFVPSGYVSGTSLSSTATFDNTTLAALGVATGTYTWTWGTGADADSLTLYAGVPAPTSTPEPAPALLLTLGAAAIALLRWRSSTLNRKR